MDYRSRDVIPGGTMTQAMPAGRRARKKSRTRRALFEAAERLALEQGFDALTVEAICREADVARGTFFLHFPNKAALLAEAELALVHRLDASNRDAVARLGPRLWLDALAEAWPQGAGLLRPMLGGLLAGASGVGESLPARLEDWVRQGQQERGLRRDVEASLIARQWLATAAAVFSTPAPPSARACEQALSLLLRGQSATKPRLKWTPASPTVAN